jgi:hypothetical protein
VSTFESTANSSGLVPSPPNDATKFLNGIGTYSVPSWEIRTVSGAATLAAFTRPTLVLASGSGYTITLPTAAGSTGFPCSIKRTSTGSAITVDGNGAETIDDAATVLVTNQYDGETIISDGSEWWRI